MSKIANRRPRPNKIADKARRVAELRASITATMEQVDSLTRQALAADADPAQRHLAGEYTQKFCRVVESLLETIEMEARLSGEFFIAQPPVSPPAPAKATPQKRY